MTHAGLVWPSISIVMIIVVCTPPAIGFDRHELGASSHLVADPHRRREADLVDSVVHAHRHVLDVDDLWQETIRQGKRQVAMGDRTTERARARALRIDVDPLMVTGGIGELIDRSIGSSRANR